MLEITIPYAELYDSGSRRIIKVPEQTLKLEHSLVSLSKWESKWHKPFLSKEQKTYEEVVDYVKCMTLTQNVNPYVYLALTNDNMQRINEYLNDPMTATTFSKDRAKPSRDIITSEVIYQWMISLNVPFECQKWHLNRLFTLLKVCGIKSQPPKKMSKRETASRNAALNQARRKQLNSKG